MTLVIFYIFLGFIIGLLVTALLFVILAYFRRIIEPKILIAKSQLESKGPLPSGFIIEPESEAEEIRKNRVLRNAAQGNPPKFEELL